jgi:hypothetical protein
LANTISNLCSLASSGGAVHDTCALYEFYEQQAQKTLNLRGVFPSWVDRVSEGSRLVARPKG